MQNTVQLLEDSLLVIWNDRDAARRLAAMEKVYAADMTFYESNGVRPLQVTKPSTI